MRERASVGGLFSAYPNIKADIAMNTNALPCGGPPWLLGWVVGQGFSIEKLSHVLLVKQNGSHNPANMSVCTCSIENFECADLSSTLPLSETSF